VVVSDAMTPSDPFWTSVTTLLHGDGPSPSYGNWSFVDSSPTNAPITLNGYCLQGAVSPYQGVGGSAYLGFAGATDFLQAPNNSLWQFGSGPFTVECWVRPDTPMAGFQSLVSQWNSSGQPNNAWLLALGGASGKTPTFFISNDGVNATYLPPGPDVVPGQWNHIAVCRVGDLVTVYTNGVGVTTNITGTMAASTELLGIGWRRNGGTNTNPAPDPFKGYISDVRISKGTALYTANFAPPVAPLDGFGTHFCCNFRNASIEDSARRSPIGIGGNVANDRSSYAKWAPGSLYFNGASYLIGWPYKPANWDFGLADFTIECWFYVSGDSALDGNGNRTACLLSDYTYGAPSHGWTLTVTGNATETGTGINLRVSNSGVDQDVVAWTAGASLKGGWHHLAVSRAAGVFRMHVNGQLVASSGATSLNVPGTNYFFAGWMAYAGYERYFIGLLDEVRLTKGVSRYGNANYPPPPGPFANGLPTG